MDNMCEDRAMAVFADDGRDRVAVLVRDGVLPFELSIVHRIFGQARTAAGAALYEVVTCAPVPGDIRTDADFAVTVKHGPEALAEAGTVVIPGSEADYEPHDGPLEPSLAAALARVRPGTRIASYPAGEWIQGTGTDGSFTSCQYIVDVAETQGFGTLYNGPAGEPIEASCAHARQLAEGVVAAIPR
jgi:hypothetical protein